MADFDLDDALRAASGAFEVLDFLIKTVPDIVKSASADHETTTRWIADNVHTEGDTETEHELDELGKRVRRKRDAEQAAAGGDEG